MSWKDSIKKKYLEISRRVIERDAPVEIEQEVEIRQIGPTQYKDRILLSVYVNFMIDQIMNDPSWPKRYRNKPVICPVTGEETQHPFGLSARAWELVEKGLAYEARKRQEAVGRETYCFHPGWANGLTKTYRYIPADGNNEHYEPLDVSRDNRRTFRDNLDSLVFLLIGRSPRRARLNQDETPESKGWVWLPRRTVCRFPWVR